MLGFCHLQLLNYAGLFSEKLDSVLHFVAVEFVASDKSANEASPALLYQNCLPPNVLVAPFAPQHPPARLNVQGCLPLLLSLLLSLSTHSQNELVPRLGG